MTWVEWNKTLRETTDLKKIKRMFNDEKARPLPRPLWLKRARGRYNVLRRALENAKGTIV
jgi:hypothetical protein